ncbi:MAG TPA: hypothetical protein VN380_01005 [Thermoanaerobaculia bacterium]|jgi:hypothetical protein|nr:hypothetical protein [Thermoanaerobaculia bacterium]
MKAASLVITLISLALCAAAQTLPRAAAAGCITSMLSCNTSDTGELAAGDCTLSDGLRYDLWTFAGAAGQRITATLTPLDSSYEKPRLALISPESNETLSVLGPAPLSFQFDLGRTGTWTLAVGTEKLFDAGRYQIALQCGPGDTIGFTNCLSQTLSCGQTFRWSVTSDFCQFAGGGWPFADFTVPLAQGDNVGFSVHSADYDPGVGVYFSTGGDSLVHNFGKRATQDAAVDFTAPVTTNYLIAAYGSTPQSRGDFSITQTCIATCTPPSITNQPTSQNVVLGGSAVLTVAAALNTSPVNYFWYDADIAYLPLPLGSGPSYTVRNVTTKRRIYAQASNGCGVQTSSIATIAPLPPARGRAVRR